MSASASRPVVAIESLGAGRPVSPMAYGPREVVVVGDALASAAEAIGTRTRELETVLSTVPAGVWFTYDPEARRVVRNRFAAELIRVPPGESEALDASGKAFGHIILLRDGTPVSADKSPLRRAMMGERLEDEEYTFVFNDGTSRTLLTSASALRDEKGAVLGAVRSSSASSSSAASIGRFFRIGPYGCSQNSGSRTLMTSVYARISAACWFMN